MKIKTPKEAIRKTRLGALLFLKGRYTSLSMVMPTMADRIEAKKKREWD
jgi:hypothetical protein